MARAKSPRSRKSAKAPAAAEPVAVVGIGVCLASLRSLEQLFAAIGEDFGAAYMIAVRQQDGLTSETVFEALGR